MEPPSIRVVSASLNYSKPLETNKIDEEWYIDTITNQDGSKISNFENDTRQILITDIRGREDQFTLDTKGFQPIVFPTNVASSVLLEGGDDVKQQYYPEVEELIKKVTGANRVVFFDHTIRFQKPGPDDDPLHRLPVTRVHVDQTPESSHARISQHVQLPLLWKRFQIINVWRPIENIVKDFPLALGDFNTFNIENDMVVTKLIYPPWLKDKETFAIKYNPEHKWYFWGDMTPNEILMFKIYDSESEKLAKSPKFFNNPKVDISYLTNISGFTPHTAFYDEDGAKSAIPRQSIEVRALVFHY
eukprot:gene2167-2667_t